MSAATYSALRGSIEYCEDALRARFPTTGAAVPLARGRLAWNGHLEVTLIRPNGLGTTAPVRLIDAALAVRIEAAHNMPTLVEALRAKERAMRDEVPAAVEAFAAIGAALLEEAEEADAATCALESEEP